MMNTLKNKVILIGRLGRDPEIHQFDDDTKIARVSLATSEKYTDRKGHSQQVTQWHNLVAWNGMAQLLEEFLMKGQEVAVEGTLRYRSFEDRKGKRRQVTEIVIREVCMLRSPKSEYEGVLPAREPLPFGVGYPAGYPEEYVKEDTLIEEEE